MTWQLTYQEFIIKNNVKEMNKYKQENQIYTYRQQTDVHPKEGVEGLGKILG